MTLYRILGCLSFALIGLLVLPHSAEAQSRVVNDQISTSTRQLYYQDSHYPSFVRISVFGGASMPDTSSSNIGLSGGVLAEFGRGLFTFEAGLEYMSLATPVGLTDNSGAAAHKIKVMSNYAGLPLLAKLNYIEHSRSSFAFKLGAMPAMMTNNRDPLTDTTGAAQSVVLNGNELFLVTGFTGTASMSKTVAFLIDGSYLFGTSDVDDNGTHSQGLVISAGLKFNL